MQILIFLGFLGGLLSSTAVRLPSLAASILAKNWAPSFLLMFTSRKLCHNWLKFRTRRQRKKWKWQQLVFLVLEPIRFGMERDRQKKRNVAKIETWKVKGPNIQNYKKCINCGQVFWGKIIITYITIITNNKKREKLIITCITCITYITSIVGIFWGRYLIITFITNTTIITKIKNLILGQFWILGIFGGKTHYYHYYLYYHYYQN